MQIELENFLGATILVGFVYLDLEYLLEYESFQWTHQKPIYAPPNDVWLPFIDNFVVNPIAV